MSCPIHGTVVILGESLSLLFIVVGGIRRLGTSTCLIRGLVGIRLSEVIASLTLFLRFLPFLPPLCICLLFLVNHTGFQGFQGRRMKALATVNEIGSPFHWHCKVKESFQFICGEAFTSTRAWELIQQQIYLLHLVEELWNSKSILFMDTK